MLESTQLFKAPLLKTEWGADSITEMPPNHAAPAELSDAAKRFISQHIKKLDDLHVLMLLQTDPKRIWDAEDVAKELRQSPLAVSIPLVARFLGGLVEHPKNVGRMHHFKIDIKPSFAKVVDEVSEIYFANRELLVDYVSSLQKKQILAFGDAFKFKEDGQ